MRKAVLLIASMVLGVLLVGGVALAINKTCGPGSTLNDPCQGTQEDDTLIGTDQRDTMEGLAGDDHLNGKRLSDELRGDEGNDVLRGEGGRDFLYGDSKDLYSLVRGNDRLVGGPQDDLLKGGPGIDRMSGGRGYDTLQGRVFGSATKYTNYDYMHGNDGNDTITGFEGELYGEEGADYVGSMGGDSILEGGPGNDTLEATACEANTIADATGGPGEDYLKAYPGYCDNDSPLGTSILRAVDGESDTINCYEAANETVRVDWQDTFYEYEPLKIGREYCDSLTIVE